ncbi:hypothetical protein D3C75_589820 [compost metagenome]
MLASQAISARLDAVAWDSSTPTISVVWPMCVPMAALILSNFQKPSARPRRLCTQGSATCSSQSSICGASSYRRTSCLASSGTNTSSKASNSKVNRPKTTTTPQVRDSPRRSRRSTSGSAR